MKKNYLLGKLAVALLLITAASTGLSAQVTILNQGFDSSPADTWGYTTNPGSGTIFLNAGFYNEPSTPNALVLRGGPGDQTNPNIVFNNVDISAYSNVTISVDFAQYRVESTDDFDMLVSYDNGATFPTVITLTDGTFGGTTRSFDFGASGGYVGANPYTFNVPAVATQVMVMFRFTETATFSNTADYFFMDDVRLEGLLPASEIDIIGNGVDIADGDTTPSVADDTDFGLSSIGIPVVHTFTIENDPSAGSTLNLTGSPLVDISGSSDFSITAQPATNALGVAATTTFQVAFNPTTAGVKTAIISIDNDDANENPYNFTIQGAGLAASAEMDVFGSGLEIVDDDTTPSVTDDTDFGSTTLALPLTRTYTISNFGTTNLNLFGASPVTISGSTDFTVVAQPASPILPGTSVTFQVLFTPSVAGTANATVNIANNDSDENPYNYDIQANVLSTVSLYCEDFTTPSGWTVASSTNGTWLEGSEATMSAGATGNYAYSQRFSGQYQNNAFIEYESPSYDLTGYEHLVLQLDYNTDTQVNRDFLNIYFSNNGGANWYRLGHVDVGEGVNWYNTKTGGTYGWTGNSGSWITAEIDLESMGFDNQSDIRFRVRFDSDGSTRDVGVAFDNFCIIGDPIVPKTYLTCGPGGIGNDLELWLRADSMLGTVADGTIIDTWEDQAFGTKWTNATSSGAERPTFYDNAANNVNFNPVVSFDGTNAMYGKKGFFNHEIYVVINPRTTISSSLPTQDVFLGDDYLEIPLSEDVTGISIGNTSARFVNDVVAYNQASNTKYGKGVVSTTLSYDRPVIFSTSINSAGNGMDLFLDGINLDVLSVTQEVNLATYKDILDTRWWLGKSEFFGPSFDGDMLEIVVFSSTKSAIEKTQIESYLAMKYGITMGFFPDPIAGVPHIPKSLFDSSTTPIWDTAVNVGYTYNVAAVGRDDCAGLYQKQARSVDPGTVLTLGLGDIYNTNSTNPNTFADDFDFLVWGTNGRDMANSGTPISVDLGPATVTTLTEVPNRIWKITERATGDIGTVKVSVATADLAGLPALSGNDAYVMILADDDSFTTAVETIFLTANGADQEAYYDFDGTKFFTFGVAHETLADRHVEFDGTDDFSMIGDRVDITGPFSISAWIYNDGSNDANGDKTIIAKRGSGSDGYHFLVDDSNRVVMRFDSGGSDMIISNTNLPDNQWHHVAFTFDGARGNLYIDGVIDESQNMSAPTANSHYLSIGARYIDKTTEADYFKGYIEEIRMWNIALSVDHIRYVMNQEIENDGSGNVDGEILPLGISKNDINSVQWADLLAYYSMNAFIGTSVNDVSGNANRASLADPDKFELQDQTAPLPYVSTADGPWEVNGTWANGSDLYVPNDNLTINGIPTDIDWNIVQVGDNVVANDDKTVLGLFSTANELSVVNDSELMVTHYLDLDGVIDLEGESQLVQDDGSDLEVASAGYIERDQQGTADSYTYNYWSSPVGNINTTANNQNIQLSATLMDGTVAASPVGINFQPAYDAADGGPTSPITISSYWIFRFVNSLADDYDAWLPTGSVGDILAGEGYTMKGAGTGGVFTDQNYVYMGKPNNGDISLTLSAGNEYLVGNPYPSAIDADEFIADNTSTTGSLYFWQHWGGGTHVLSGYQGGYAIYNLSGGVSAVSHPSVDQTGSGTKTPERYIPVAQGFFVEGSIDGTVNFENDQRIFVTEASGNSIYIRGAVSSQREEIIEEDTRTKVRLKITTPGEITRELLLTIDENTTDGIDWAYDAKLIESQEDDAFWLIDDIKHVIQAIPESQKDKKLPLGVSIASAGEVSFELFEVENDVADMDLYLLDKETSEVYDLRAASVTVDLNAIGDHNERFELLFNDPFKKDIGDPRLQDVVNVSYLNDKKIIRIENQMNINLRSVSLFNMMGQMTNVWNLNTESIQEIQANHLINGAYILKIETDDEEVTKKFMVN
ncbi:choice-of-anchor D domain-containing protein [Sungkyunkwania multivorans]|uniref:Choice-of-anchor D domain-containing protein n=1 Tax=Sungkyunkwania multivorans TaxID=1173618 RepID=A0ABW3CY59_9FLAO